MEDLYFCGPKDTALTTADLEATFFKITLACLEPKRLSYPLEKTWSAQVRKRVVLIKNPGKKDYRAHSSYCSCAIPQVSCSPTKVPASKPEYKNRNWKWLTFLS